MKLAHSISISVFVKHGEDEAAMRQALLSLVPFQDLEKEKVKLKRTAAEGFDHKIVILEITLEKERHTATFIASLKEKLAPSDIRLLATQENRVDEECCFYLRLDRQKLMSGECALTDSGDCFHIKMSLAAFPKKRQVALQVAEKMFS